MCDERQPDRDQRDQGATLTTPIVAGWTPDISGRNVVVAQLQFPNLPIAERHAEEIKAALQLLNGTLERAFDARNDERPSALECPYHKILIERFSRDAPPRAICGTCLTVFVEDVNAWMNGRELGDSRVSIVNMIEREANAGKDALTNPKRPS